MLYGSDEVAMNATNVMLEAVRAQQSGKLDAAAAAYRQVLDADPKDADALNNLGIILAQKGDLSAAADCLARALEIRPDSSETLGNLANLYVKLDKIDEAADAYRKALDRNPQNVDALNNLGLLYEKQNRHAEAAYYWERQYELNPKSPEAMAGLARNRRASGLDKQAMELYWSAGTARFNRQEYADALSCYMEAMTLDPNSARNHGGVGVALLMLGQREEAMERYRKAIALDPRDPQTYARFAYGFSQANLWNEAVASYRQAQQLAPNNPKRMCSLGKALLQTGQRDEALAWIERAIEADAGFLEARLARAQFRLESGDLERGWPEYEMRFLWPQDIRPRFDRPLWNGSPLAGRSIMVVPEQGLGDILQFVRYAALLKDAGAGSVVVACPPSMKSLLATCPGIERVVAVNEPVPRTDLAVMLLSLPRLFKTSMATIPANTPYLTADPERVEHWRRELSTSRGFKVGFVWQGNPGLWADRRRSVPLQRFAAVAEVKGVEFFSLQKDAPPMASWQAPFLFTDLGPKLDTFGETAAILKNLDLVITVDTAVAHLAGALHVPVWAALRFASDWRWLRDREDSPWYPSMRLFRQRTPDDWTDVFLQIRAELAELSFRHHGGAAPELRSAVVRQHEKQLADAPRIGEADDPKALAAIGKAYVKVRRYEEAAVNFRKILDRNPDDADALNDLAVATASLGRHDEARKLYERVIEINPKNATALNGLGVELFGQGRFDEAHAAYERSLAIEPGNVPAHFNRAVIRLMAGDFERGFAEHEWRLRLDENILPAFLPPRWDGSDPSGKTILLFGEQGFGDSVQFVRYAEHLKRAGARTVIGAARELAPLLETCPWIDQSAPLDRALPHFDAYIPMMSLPYLFRTTRDTIPAHIPYLFPGEMLVANWRRELEPVREAKVGFVWQGSKLHRNDRERSIPIDKFIQIAAVPRVRLYSLQKETDVKPPFAMTDLSGRLETFLDTAAVIKNLDLVITPDTAVAHVAGALGVPVWIALPYVPDWRWMLGREDSPWYPTMWIVRQSRRGVWDDVFERMAAELVKFTRSLT
jgi:tetratricopeptide (TPR) repeat protein